MPRIPGIDPATGAGYVGRVLQAQANTWGAPLNNHLLYARRPDLFKAVRGMWTALNKDQLLEPGLEALINRRVAMHNGCVF